MTKAQKKALRREKRIAKKEQKKKEGGGAALTVISIVLFLLIIIIATGAATIYFCPVKEVVCSGTDLYTDEEITAFVLDDKYSTNSVYVFLKNYILPKKDVPFIKSFQVTLKDPNTVVIKAKEKTFYGYMVTEENGYVYFDEEEKVYEISERQVEGGTLIEGLTPENPVIGEELAIGQTNVKTLRAILDGLAGEELAVSSVSFTEDGTILLSYGDITINLGTRSNIAEKIRRLSYILPYIEGKSGTLHLEEWTEENTDIVFDETTEQVE